MWESSVAAAVVHKTSATMLSIQKTFAE